MLCVFLCREPDVVPSPCSSAFRSSDSVPNNNIHLLLPVTPAPPFFSLLFSLVPSLDCNRQKQKK